MAHLLNLIIGIQTAFAQQNAQGSNAATETGSQFQKLADSVIQSIPFWITGFIVVIISFFLARIVKNAVENRMTAAGIEEEHREIQIVAGRASSAAVLIIGITAGLKIAGLDLTSIIAAAAFGVGFALQDIIMNFMSGIIVLLQKRFTIGDWIKVNGTEGVIKEIQSRYTIIKKFDGTNVVVPNSELFKNQVNSLTSNPVRRFQFNIKVDFYADLKEIIDSVYESIDKCPKILKQPKPSIIVQQPGDYYNNIRIRAWVESRKGILKPMSALIRQIHKDFYRKGWSWPYPVNDVYFDKEVPPEISKRAKDYIEKHRKALKQEAGLVEQQQKILTQQETKGAVQAQQIGVGTPSMEAPVWLQQAGQQGNAPQDMPGTSQVASPQPLGSRQTQNMAPLVIQDVSISPEMKIVSGPEKPEGITQAPPVVMAPVVQASQPATPPAILPLPDVEPNISQPEPAVAGQQQTPVSSQQQ